ncbi:MAG: hypothetical protein V1721_04100 [Pseudomonadota bacterium]
MLTDTEKNYRFIFRDEVEQIFIKFSQLRANTVFINAADDLPQQKTKWASAGLFCSKTAGCGTVWRTGFAPLPHSPFIS